jgi:hypothetical protein
MNEWQVLMAMEARYERGRCRHRPAWSRFWKRWTSFGMRLWRCWGRVEMVAVLRVLEGLNAKAKELETIIATNVAGVLEREW